jgi:glycosyltransferase involved in cell wall biosynthesis
MSVLFGQPQHLSTSYQTEQLMGAAREYFEVHERHFAFKDTGWYATQLRRVWANVVEPVFYRRSSDYLFYGNDGFADLRRWKNHRVVYWYDTPWDYFSQPPSPRQWKDWLRCENVRCADTVLAVSDIQVRTARRLRPGREDSVHYLPVGVDCRHYSPDRGREENVRELYGLAHDAVVIGYLGYLAGVGGRMAGQVLLEAAPEIARRYEKAHFLIVGYGPGLASLKQLVAADGLTSRFTFTGYIPPSRLPSFIAGMDICIDTLEPGFHSEARSETKLKQYIAMGRACVATAIGENKVDLDQGACGCLVEPGVAPLVAGIASLIENPEMRKHYGFRCRERALAAYDWPVLARKMAGVLLTGPSSKTEKNKS